MKTRTKVLWILGVPILMVILAIILVPRLMPEEKLRRVVLPRASKALGRSVDCGKISLGFGLGGLKLDVRDIELGAEDSGQGLTGLKLPRVTAHLALRPLLRKEIEVTTLMLSQPQVTLVVPTADNEREQRELAAAPAAVVLAAPDVRLEGGALRIVGEDGLAGEIRIDQGRFATLINEAGDIDLTGKLTLSPIQMLLPLKTAPGSDGSGGTTEVTGQRTELDLALLLLGEAGEIQIEELVLQLQDLQVTTTLPTGEQVTVQGEGLDMIMTGKIPLPTPDSEPLTPDELPLEMDLKLLQTVITAPGLTGPVTITEVNLDGGPTRINIASMGLTAGSSSLTLSGLITGGIAAPLMDLTLLSSGIDLGDFIPPPPETPPAGQGSPPVAEGEQPPVIPPLLLPGQLAFQVDRLATHRMEMTDLSGKVIVEGDRIRVEDLQAALYDGGLQGSLTLQALPGGSADCLGKFVVNRVQAPTFLAAFTPVDRGVDGILDTDLTFNLQITPAAEPEDLTLDAEVDLERGALLGISAIHSICGAVGLPKRDRYDLGQVHLPLQVRDDRVITDDLRFPLEGGLVEGSGSTGLDGTLDYRGKYTIAQAALAKLDRNSALQWLKNDQGDVVVSFSLGGRTTHPSVTLDVAPLQDKAQEFLEEEGEELLEQGVDALKKLFK